MKNFSLFIAGLVLSMTAQAGEYLVKYKDGQYRAMMAVSGFEIKDFNDAGNLLKINVPESKKLEIIADLYDSGAEYVVPNAKVHAFDAPVTTSALKEQWHIAKINAEAAWKRAGNRGNRKVLVAVIDTGADYRHESLAPNMVAGYDFNQNDNDPMDKTGPQNPGHGTHCSGIIGGTGIVDGGIIGMSPEVSIMPIRFLDENGSGDLNNGIKAIDYAIEKGVHVISASWGAGVSRSQAQPLIEAVQRATAKGIIFVAAASNDGKNNDSYEVYPANTGGVNFISVAASGPNDEKPSWSNYGRARVNLASPGLNIMSTVPGNKYSNMSGTSMATPLAAGLVAFLKAQDMSLTGEQIKAILVSTGAKTQINTQCNCRIDALAAVETILDKKPVVVPSAGAYGLNETFKAEAMNMGSDVTFTSSNDGILKVDASGNVTAAGEGEATITAKSADGKTVSSLPILVGKAQSSNPGDDPGNDPGNGECPIGSPEICQIICQIKPDLPFCK